MMLSGRPLLDNPVDNRLYVGNDGYIEALTTSAVRRLNVLLSGSAGMGKTSLARAWMYRTRLDRPDLHVTYVRVAGETSGLDLLAASVRALTGGSAAVQRDGVDWELLQSDIESFKEAVASDLSQAGHIVGEGLRLVVVLDDVKAGAGHDLFGRWRDELWELGVQWVVLARPDVASALRQPPSDAFFEKTIELAPLDDDTVADLLVRRAAIAESDALRLAHTAAGNPRLLLTLARKHLVDGTMIEDIVAGYEHREKALLNLGRPAMMLVDALEELGGSASASSQELLDIVGWTRPRVMQVMSQLETAQLVTTSTVKDGPGRPRKVFHLAETGMAA